MRLHRLEVTAFGPFANTVEVDLDALSDAGLFLLTGPTGAGKTSVLDAVCFALYGDVPGDRGSAKRLRADQAAPGVRPRVELELSVAGRRLRLVRTPAWEREKLRGTGTTTEQASVVLAERLPDGEWRTLSTRLDETGHLVGDLLGMTLTQFTQVAMLPQGRFQAFLRAKSEDRHKLLQQLFRTGRFEDVEAWLRDLRTGLRRESGRLQQVVADLASRVSETADVQPPEPDTWEETLLPWAVDRRAAAHADRDRAEGARRDAEATEARARAALDRARAAHEQHQRWSRARSERAALLARADEHAQQLTALGEARRAVPVVLAERQRSECVEAAARLEARIASLRDDLPVAVPGEDLAPHEEALLLAAGRVRGALPRLRELDALEHRLPGLQESRRRALAEVEACVADVAEAPDRVRVARERLAALQADAAALPVHEAALAGLRESVGAALEARVVEAELAPARAEHLAARELTVTRHERLLAVREARIESMASELAGSLAVGGCCPVCGSHDHPAKAQPGPDATDAAAEKDAQRLLDDAKTDEHLRAEHVRDLETRLALLRDRAGDTDPDAATDEMHRHEEACAGARAAVEQVPLATTTLADAEQAAAEAGAALERARAHLVEAKQQHTDGVRDVDRLDAEVAAAGSLARLALAGGDPAGLDPAEPELPLDGRPDLAALERALDRRLGVVRQLRDLTREQAIAEESATQALSRCEEAVTEAGFADLGSALAAALPAAEQERLSTAVEAHRARLAAVTEVLADAPDPGEELALPDLEVLAARHADAHAGLATALTGATTSRVRAERLDALVLELTGALETWAPVQEQLRLATSVSAFVDGRSADNPLQMRLSAYVLAWRLSQVVAAANERLARMSDQRYSLEHTGRRGAGETRGGLSLLVRDDWSGESRDPVTLSGGETFVVSLALALGLADVIAQEAGGTELDTLFVDEGFGSLDPDTLEDVMDTLDSLREGGRVVGVVSHVTEMRDRIPVQLHVTKGRSGSSVRLSRGV